MPIASITNNSNDGIWNGGHDAWYGSREATTVTNVVTSTDGLPEVINCAQPATVGREADLHCG